MSQPEGAEPALSQAEGPAPTPASPEGPALNEVEGTRQERRSRKKKKERERMPQHGKGLAQIYKDAVTKRAKNQDSLEG